MATGTLYALLAAGAILSTGEGILAKFASRYFERELSDGTPFTIGGAKELQRLGILAICLPLGTQILAQIVNSILSHTLAGAEAMNLDSFSSVSIGVMMIVMAQVCKYGAELIDGNKM